MTTNMQRRSGASSSTTSKVRMHREWNYYILDVNDPYITRVCIGNDQELKNYLLFRASRPSNNQLFLHIDTIPHPDNALKPRSPVRPPAILTNFPRSSGNSPIILSPKTDGSSPRTTVSSPRQIHHLRLYPHLLDRLFQPSFL